MQHHQERIQTLPKKKKSATSITKAVFLPVLSPNAELKLIKLCDKHARHTRSFVRELILHPPSCRWSQFRTAYIAQELLLSLQFCKSGLGRTS